MVLLVHGLPLDVIERNMEAIRAKGPASLTDQKTLEILDNMKFQAEGVIREPEVYIP